MNQQVQSFRAFPSPQSLYSVARGLLMTSSKATYTSLIANLRQKQKELARKIEPKVYEYGFLKK